MPIYFVGEHPFKLKMEKLRSFLEILNIFLGSFVISWIRDRSFYYVCVIVLGFSNSFEKWEKSCSLYFPSSSPLQARPPYSFLLEVIVVIVVLCLPLGINISNTLPSQS